MPDWVVQLFCFIFVLSVLRLTILTSLRTEFSIRISFLVKEKQQENPFTKSIIHKQGIRKTHNREGLAMTSGISLALPPAAEEELIRDVLVVASSIPLGRRPVTSTWITLGENFTTISDKRVEKKNNDNH